MRIIAGECRGRKLHPLRIPGVRPTPDRVREAVFNILSDRVHGASAADLYAGTGAMGLEALSRGAAHCVFVDGSPKAAALIRDNLNLLNLGGRAEVLRWSLEDGARSLARTGRQFDLVFADPPYALDALALTLSHLAQAQVLKSGAMVVFERPVKNADVPPGPDFTLTDRRRYGKSLVSFFTFMI